MNCTTNSRIVLKSQAQLFFFMSSISRRVCWGRYRASPSVQFHFVKHCRQSSWSKTRLRMEEEARKLLEEGISKKLLHPGRGELPAFSNGTKVTNWTRAVRKLKRSLCPPLLLWRCALANATSALARVFAHTLACQPHWFYSTLTSAWIGTVCFCLCLGVVINNLCFILTVQKHIVLFAHFYLMEKRGRDRMGCVYKRNWTMHHFSQCYRTVIGHSTTVPTTFSLRVKGLSENCSFPIVSPFSLPSHRKVPLYCSVCA